MKRNNRQETEQPYRHARPFRRCKGGKHQYVGEPLECAKCGARYKPTGREHYP